MSNYQIVRFYDGTKGYGKVFGSQEEAEYYLETDPKVQQDIANGFFFTTEPTEKPISVIANRDKFSFAGAVLLPLEIGKPAYIYYIDDKNKGSLFKTSSVSHFAEHGTLTTVITENSIYEFNYTGVNVPAQFIAMAITDYKFCRKETKK